MRQLELITVSDGFADFLAETLPRNAPHFDRIVVVTSKGDGGTERVVKQHRPAFGVGMVQTDAFKQVETDIWNKGRAINDGLRSLQRRGWIVHLDADMILPEDFRDRLDAMGRLHPATLYGCQRMFCDSAEDWNHYRIQKTDERLRADKVHSHGNDALPVGYFQLFHGQAKPMLGNGPWYPCGNPQAGGSDVAFAKLFDRRQYLENMQAIHIQTEPCAEGANWKGRKAKAWPRYANLLDI